MIQAPSYYRRSFEPDQFKVAVTVLVGKLKELVAKDPEIRAIAACGNSGIPIASAAAFVTGLGLTVVRKADEPLTHSGKVVTGYVGEGKYLMVDDLIDTGKTLRHIVKSIDEARPAWAPRLNPAGVLIYYDIFGNYNFAARPSTDEERIPVIDIAMACATAYRDFLNKKEEEEAIPEVLFPKRASRYPWNRI